MSLPALKYSDLIRKKAREFSLKPSLLAAIVTQESSGDPFAARFEPGWKYFKDVEAFARKCRISADTERAAQAFSYGLTQVMGSVAREHGFYDPLPKLFDPEINLYYGARHLKKFMDIYKLEASAIVSYNAGSPRLLESGKYVNQYYLDRVQMFMTALSELDK